jgi:predicted nucleotide-binding protein
VKGNIEIPSDLQGVIYTRMDEHDAWKTKVAKEMKAAGLAVDLNKL